MIQSTPLAGLRVLLLEDEMLISLAFEEMLEDEGCVIVGPFDRVAAALESARGASIDLAILDVNVAGVMAFPVAEMLDARGIPFLFVSGYGASAISGRNPRWRVCAKPFKRDELIGMLVAQLQDGRQLRAGG